MDFLLDIGSFLLQALILLAVFLVAVAGVVAISQRKRGSGDDGYIEARLLNERYEAHQESLRAVTEEEAEKVSGSLTSKVTLLGIIGAPAGRLIPILTLFVSLGSPNSV